MRIRSLIVISLELIVLWSMSACRAPNKSAAAPEESSKKEGSEKTQEGVVKLTADQIKSSGVVTQEVVEAQLQETVSVQGRVVPRSGQQAAVTSPFPGRLMAGAGFPFVGKTVRQGQVLATLEQEMSASEFTTTEEKRIDLESQIKQSQRDMAQKTKDLERARILYEGGVIGLKQVQQAETDLEIARARHEMAVRAKERYDALASNAPSNPRRTPILAPISGAITAVNSAPNQQVDSTKPLFEIINLTVVWVEAQVFEDQLAAVRRARKAEIRTRAAPGTTFAGNLVSLSNQVDPINKTEGAIFEVANRDEVLAIGMNVDVRLPSGGVSTGLSVPASAIIEEQGHSVVYVELRAGEYQRREVKPGVRQDNRVLVTSGLTKGEKVVATGVQVLAAGGEEKKEEP